MADQRKPQRGIEVLTDSDVAGWVRWRSHRRQSPLAALGIGGKPQMAFVADEVLVEETDIKTTNRLVDHFGAEILPRLPIPPAPDGLGPAAGVDAAKMPVPLRLRLPAPPPASARTAQILRDTYSEPAEVTSVMGAGVLGLVAELASDGHQIGLNVIGQGTALPLLASLEGANAAGGSDPFAWPAYAGRARVTAAWQLIEAYRSVASIKSLVTVGVLDSGFWLNGRVPGFPAGQSGSDFGTFVFQLNLLDESVGAGGASGIECGTGYNCPWHGNGVAGIAAAPVGNFLGIAGVGGTVARPALFKTETTIDQVFRCLQICLAWGIDVLNMSFAKKNWELVFPTSSWNKAFQFAADNGLILVAAAGNDSENLPDDDNPRPATRTPGTITVGALDQADQAASFSNYGPSIDIWAPGTNLPALPDPNNPAGSLLSGTSVAAPFVSGVIAMMRAVNSSVSTFDAKRLLTTSGWKGSGRVTVGVDAFQAVLAAIGGKLPTDLAELNNTPATASPLFPFGPNGDWVPIGNLGQKGLAVLSTSSEVDWYRFRLNEFSEVTLQLGWYPLLGYVQASLEPDDPDSRAADDLTSTFSSGRTTLAWPLPPGDYKLRISGSMNLYELSVGIKAAPLKADEFEPNNSFDQATRFRLRAPGAPRPTIFDLLSNGPGTYNLTLLDGDLDFFRFEADASIALPLKAAVRISKADTPLDISLFAADRKLLQQLNGVRSGSLALPLGETSFVEVSGAKPGRYVFTVQYEVDQSVLPKPHQKAVVVPLPDLGDPATRFTDGEKHILIDLSRGRVLASRLAFASVEDLPLSAELLNDAGKVVATGSPISDGLHHSIEIQTADLPQSIYVLRLTSAGEHIAGTTANLSVERVPPAFNDGGRVR